MVIVAISPVSPVFFMIYNEFMSMCSYRLNHNGAEVGYIGCES